MRPELPVDKVGIDEFEVKDKCEKEWEYVMLPTFRKRVCLILNFLRLMKVEMKSLKKEV